MKAQIFGFIFTLSYFLTIAQSEFGAKISFGVSKVNAKRNIQNIESQIFFAPSGQGGFFYKLGLGKRSVLGAELLFSQIEGKEKMTLHYVDGYGNVYADDGYLELDYHLSYLVMPLTYGLKFKKVTYSLGAQVAYEIANGAHEEGDMPLNGTRVKYENDGEINTDKVDFGVRGVVFYELSAKFSLEANYYYGINNILADNPLPGWDWRNQQLTIGFRYSILKK